MTTNQNPPTYTGDIAEQHIDPAREYSAENQEINFSAEQHAIWADLYTGVHQPYLLEHICQEFKDGLARLELDPKARERFGLADTSLPLRIFQPATAAS